MNELMNKSITMNDYVCMFEIFTFKIWQMNFVFSTNCGNVMNSEFLLFVYNSKLWDILMWL